MAAPVLSHPDFVLAQASADIPPTSHASAMARHVVYRAGQKWHLPTETIEAAAAVVAGLVQTSVAQARSIVHLTMVGNGESLLIEIEDRCTAFPTSARDSDGVNGLDLVHTFATESGYVRLPDGRQLWARVNVTTGPPVAGSTRPPVGRSTEAPSPGPLTSLDGAVGPVPLLRLARQPRG
jgi:hypothetical protein